MDQELLHRFDESIFELPHISVNLFQYLRAHGARTIADAYAAIGHRTIHPALKRELLAVFEMDESDFNPALPARMAQAKAKTEEGSQHAHQSRSAAHEVACTIKLADLNLPGVFMMWIESFGIETLGELHGRTIPKRALIGEFPAIANQLFRQYGLPERSFSTTALKTK